jgi:hypothetical protein
MFAYTTTIILLSLGVLILTSRTLPHTKYIEQTSFWFKQDTFQLLMLSLKPPSQLLKPGWDGINLKTFLFSLQIQGRPNAYPNLIRDKGRLFLNRCSTCYKHIAVMPLEAL